MKIKIRTNKKNIILEGFDVEPDQNSEEEEQFLKSRLTDKDISQPGVKELLKLGYIPIVKSIKNTNGFRHTILLGQGSWRKNL